MIKQFLKRLFCKHEWEEIEGSRHMIYEGMSKGAKFKCNKCGCNEFSVIMFEPLTVVCKNCGKQIDSDKFIVKEVDK